MIYSKHNREKRLQPRHGLFWCYRCDCELVGRGSKCNNCGCRPDVKRLKK